MGLRDKVINRINELGVKEAAKLFGVSIGTASNWASGKTPPSLDAAELVLSESKPDTAQEPLLWEGRKVAMLLPVYRTMNPDTHYTLFANYVSYGPTKIAIPKPVKGTCIWEARNIMVNQAHRMEGIERYIMCDDDMILPHGHAGSFNLIAEPHGTTLPDEMAALNSITRVISHGYDKGIVGALYFGRHGKGKAQCALGFNDPSSNELFRTFKKTGLYPDRWVGTGFIKIEKWVIDRMKEAIDGGKWPECKPRPEQGCNYYGYFNPIAVGIGEDVSFCSRAAEIGIQTYVDASLVPLHAGEAYYGPKNTKS